MAGIQDEKSSCFLALRESMPRLAKEVQVLKRLPCTRSWWILPNIPMEHAIRM
jgi:hypothetical protein